MLLLAVTLGIQLIALPPPLCRGRVVGDYDQMQDRAPSPRALAEVKAAYEALCPKRNCGRGLLFQNPTAGNNALTWVSGIRDGQATTARIVYGPQFLDGLEGAFGPGASFGVLAHEVGHHLTAALSVRLPTDSSWDEELRADYLAGCALARAGRPPDELENALRALAETASPTHPSFAHRVPAVRKGYDDCRPGKESPQAPEPRDRAPPTRTPPRGAEPFGLGPWFRRDMPGEARCWRYAYRLTDDLERLGPVVAAKRRSGSFASRDACEAHRLKMKMKDHGSRLGDECTCE